MADPSTCPALTPASIRDAHAKISKHIHRTPLLTSKTLDRIASAASPDHAAASPREVHEPEATAAGGRSMSRPPQFRLFFKCENFQRIGAFKPRGAFNALVRLIEEMGLEEVRSRGVIAHSSGNFAQALSLAASEFDIPAHIVMPTISTPSKIAGTQANTPHVYFCGSTAAEREARVNELIKETNAILVPPYDHPDIMIGQGTAALEMDEQYHELQGAAGKAKGLDAVVSPLGGGGLTGGTAIWFSDKPTLVFGAEPEYQGANDGERGLNADPPKRIESVKTLTIADGLRTPLGHHPWKLFTSTTSTSDGADAGQKYMEQVYSVTEGQIASAMRLIMERMKLFIEPSSAVPLAVILYNERFRAWVAQEQQRRGDEYWDVGVMLSGGNTTLDAILAIFGKTEDKKREEGKVGMNGEKVAENIAG